MPPITPEELAKMAAKYRATLKSEREKNRITVIDAPKTDPFRKRKALKKGKPRKPRMLTTPMAPKVTKTTTVTAGKSSTVKCGAHKFGLRRNIGFCDNCHQVLRRCSKCGKTRTWKIIKKSVDRGDGGECSCVSHK